MGSKPSISLVDVLALSEKGYSQQEIAARAGRGQDGVNTIK